MPKPADKPTRRSKPAESNDEAVFELRVLPSVQAIEASVWDGLAGPKDYPFLRHAFLDALESTGCATEDTGWLPHHLALYEGGELRGVAPAYVKGHSQGEFVFDQGWANAAHRFGVRYFPKLLIAVPFTPATGPRVLVAPNAGADRVRQVVAAGVAQIVKAAELSSAHILFSTDDEADALAEMGLGHRLGVQFHWRNDGFDTFEDFLATLPSKKRTQIRRERKELRAAGIRIETLRRSAITDEAVDAMYAFYRSTVDKFLWGRQYLNRRFFERVCSDASLADAVEIVLARDARGHPIGGAFNLRGEHALYGRYWGAIRDVPFLHFNVCYYHSIEQCIERGIRWFEPGAGGSHKVARGFFPTLTHSLHLIAQPAFSAAIDDFLEREREALVEHITAEWGMPPRRIRSCFRSQSS